MSPTLNNTLTVIAKQFKSKTEDFFGKDLDKFRKSQAEIKVHLYLLASRQNLQFTVRSVINSLPLFKKKNSYVRCLYVSFTNGTLTGMIKKGLIKNTGKIVNRCAIYVPDWSELNKLSATDARPDKFETYKSNFNAFKNGFYQFLENIPYNEEFTRKKIFDALRPPGRYDRGLRKKYFTYLDNRLAVLARQKLLKKSNHLPGTGYRKTYMKIDPSPSCISDPRQMAFDRI